MRRLALVWLACAAGAACGGKAIRDTARAAKAAHDRGVLHERRAVAARTPIASEAHYRDALAAFAESCRLGLGAACDHQLRVETIVTEELGACDSVDQCRDLAARWLPELRGQQRLDALCFGRPVQLGRPDRRWPDDAAACELLGAFFSRAARAGDAERLFEHGCTQLRAAAACRAQGAHHMSRGEPERAIGQLSFACELPDGAACDDLARLHLATHRTAFPDDHSIRFRRAEVDPVVHLTAAHAAATVGCERGHPPACERADAIDAEIARVDGLDVARGCLFQTTCTRTEFCNKITGACEGPKNRGAFYAAFADGAAKYDAGDLPGARDAFERARAMNSDVPGPWRFLAYIYAADGRPGDCVTAANEAVRLRPKGKHTRALRDLARQCASAP